MRNPVRYPERAQSRRNVVLKQMLDNGYISGPQYVEAIKEPVVVARQGIESADAPYFVDLVNERLATEFQDRDFQESGSRIYTTLDPDLQRDAAEAVALGLRDINANILKHFKGQTPTDEPQVALICLDPHTGEVKALIGGKNYGMSQLNHAVAKRPSGSIFKPFVYATALNTGLTGQPDVMTASTMVKDEARTFLFLGKPYEPAEFHKDQWLGDVTLRRALAKSLNVPAVEVAESVGYGNVANLAHKAGLNDVRATPAMALGAYDATPLDMATAYTIFANDGVLVKPRFISEIVDRTGADKWSSKPETEKVLDPRVNFLMVNMMQEVLRSGTGAGVRSRGFVLTAAGKTGTSHDAWFAGFTTKLLCVVWVGLDNYQDLEDGTGPTKRGGCESCASHLDRVHEARTQAPCLPRCRGFRGAGRRCKRGGRSRHGATRDERLPKTPERILSGGNAANRFLPACTWAAQRKSRAGKRPRPRRKRSLTLMRRLPVSWSRLRPVCRPPRLPEC